MTDQEEVKDVKETEATTFTAPHLVFQREFATAILTLKKARPMLNIDVLSNMQQEIQMESRIRQKTLDMQESEKTETMDALEKLRRLAGETID